MVLLFKESEVASKSVHFHLVAASALVELLAFLLGKKYQEDHEQSVS